MAKRPVENKPFAGINHLSEFEEAELTKNLATLKEFAAVKTVGQLIGKEAVKVYGIDLETDKENAKTMYMGWCELNPGTGKNGYHFLYRNEVGLNGIIDMLGMIVADAAHEGRVICHFGSFDAVHLIKMCMEFNQFDEEQTIEAAQRLTKRIEGKFKGKVWEAPPIVEVLLPNGDKFGVLKMVLGCVQFYYHTKANMEANKPPRTCWTIDTSIFWKGNLTQAAKAAKLSYYSKISKRAHLINWRKFDEGFIYGADTWKDQTDPYVLEVIEANKLDSFAAKDLLKKIQKMFLDVFGLHQKFMVSPGSFTETIITDTLTDEENKSISINTQLDEWQTAGFDEELRTIAFNMFNDSYNGAIIEAIRVGFAKNIGMFDITSCYPSIMASLLDLRGSKLVYLKDVKSWADVPKPDGTNYVFVSLTLDIPKGAKHTISIKCPEGNKDEIGHRANIRGFNKITTTVLYEEVELLLSQYPKKMHDEIVLEVQEVMVIQTEGKPSPIQKVIKRLWALRQQFIRENNPAEYVVKLIMNSLYGKFYQTIKNYKMNETGIDFDGHTGGSYFNPVYAAVIGAFSRIRLVEAQAKIEENGGKTMQLLTDAIYFSKENPALLTANEYLPETFESILKNYKGLEVNGRRTTKTLGMFDNGRDLENGTFLKAAIYEVYDPTDGEYEIKLSGFNLSVDVDKTKSYLNTKIKEAVKDPVGHLITAGRYTGSYAIYLDRKEMVGFADIAYGFKKYDQLGEIKKEQTPEVVDEMTIQPKRQYTVRIPENAGKKFDYNTMQHDYLTTVECDFDDYAVIDENDPWGDRSIYDARDMAIREKAPLQNKYVGELAQAGADTMRWAEKVSALGKQIKENLDLFPQFNGKFGTKKGSYKGMNSYDIAKTEGVDFLREIIEEAGLTPVV